MSTATRLEGLIHYQQTDPLNYAEKDRMGNEFHRYKMILNKHLQGERGESTLALLSARGVNNFHPQNVKMGMTPACPMSLRKEIVAQHNYRANENRRINRRPAATNDSIRVTNLMAATLGTALSLTYRITRAVLRTLFSPITFLYALHQQNRYNIDGWAVEDLKRVSWEWIDVGTTLISFFAGVVNTFHPNAIKLDSLRDYYIERIDYAIERNQAFATAKQNYLQQRAQTSQAERA